ncbi:replication restart helicase PriA [Adlercreutzia mucosicola]|uniref:replication restart helicase PriA n=1 Tax=Adlercreutzia mucosicola TaxID=580026 RepID=UPI0004041B48|nr:primosomal protein N' [Adlercreutzia mucosicola]MCR2036201.1 primosomal protein N' [Adlercreutzia mucosicola]
MKIASVIIDIPTQALDAPYSYAVPDEMLGGEGGAHPAEVGCAVLVTLGGRKAVGYIVGLEEPAASPDEGTDLWGNPLAAAGLRQVEAVLSAPYFDEEGAAAAQYIADRYVAPLASCVRLFTPPGAVPRVVRGRDGRWRLEEPSVGEVDDRWVTRGPAFDAFQPRKNAVRQQQVMAAVAAGDVRVAELAAEFGAVSSTLRTLAARGAVVVEERRRLRGDLGPAASPTVAPPLTEGQAVAVAAIEEARAAACGRVVLIDGVTGSGKTEVYLQAIARTLDEGRSAIVLVPEISLTPQTVARFRGRFGDAVAVMHSRMSAGERYDQWDFIRSGAARVVVGARSALFTPLANVGLVVIDEEHEGSYKQDSAPRYAAGEVAAWMMERAGGTLVLGSATPSIEALYHGARDPRWTQVALTERANGRPMPPIEVVNMAAEFASGARSMFSSRLTRALAAELSAGRKAVLLLNQRGFAKFLLCRDCGFVPECPSCSTSLTYHEQGAKLVCHHCGYTVPAPPVCPECNSPYLKKFGAGTQRVEADLRALLDGMAGVGPSVPIIRMDADTTKAKGAHQALLEQFAAADAAVLLGTQMIAKGLDFDDVTLVGVINADTQLHLPDYRAGERTFQLIEQVAGRAGRANLPGRVMVQTYEADSIAIRAAAAYDRAAFLRAELPKRQMLGFPPYVRMANVLVWGADEHEVGREAELLYGQIHELIRSEVGDSRWQVLPAVPCVLGKLRNTYRYHIVVKAPQDADISAPLAKLFRARKPNPQVNAAVDVDPMDLL